MFFQPVGHASLSASPGTGSADGTFLFDVEREPRKKVFLHRVIQLLRVRKNRAHGLIDNHVIYQSDKVLPTMHQAGVSISFRAHTGNNQPEAFLLR